MEAMLTTDFLHCLWYTRSVSKPYVWARDKASSYSSLSILGRRNGNKNITLLNRPRCRYPDAIALPFIVCYAFPTVLMCAVAPEAHKPVEWQMDQVFLSTFSDSWEKLKCPCLQSRQTEWSWQNQDKECRQPDAWSRAQPDAAAPGINN